MFKPQGIIPAIVTPFTESQELDEQATRQLVNRMINAGVHGLFCLGTNGEFYALTKEEKIKFVGIVVEETAGRVPVYAGAGAISTKETVGLCESFEGLGVSALSVIAPFFLPLKPGELEAHYRSAASATSLPILMYNIPQRTGVAIGPQTAERLAAVPNIVGVKDSSGSFESILQYIQYAGPDFSVLAGSDSLIYWTLLAGGSGAVAATGNLFPELVVSIYEHWKRGDNQKAAEAQEGLRAIRSANQKLGTLPSVLKESLSQLGYPAGPARQPVEGLTDQAKEELRQILLSYEPQTGASL